MRKLIRILAPLGLVLAMIVPAGATMGADGPSTYTSDVLAGSKDKRPQPATPPGFPKGQQPSDVEPPLTGKANREHSL